MELMHSLRLLTGDQEFNRLLVTIKFCLSTFSTVRTHPHANPLPSGRVGSKHRKILGDARPIVYPTGAGEP